VTLDYYIPKATAAFQSTPVVGYYTSESIPILNPIVTNSKLEQCQFLTWLE
jgi:hypothetical protein